jgi:SAM-dependent methyltransferase
VFNLKATLHEIFRVLRPGGCVLFTCPFVWPLHEAPYDYARYTPYSLEDLVKKAGFQIDVKQQKGSAIEVIGQMVILEIIPILLRPFNRFRHIRVLVEILLTGTVNGACRLVSPFLSGSGRLYLSNVFVIRKPF